MRNLKDIVSDSETLAKGLRENAAVHRSYRMYTSMERALGFLLSGQLYISNGQMWNDALDRDVMKEKRAYGISLSCSTYENVAMWMLYGAKHGTKGAALNFPPSVINSIASVQEIEIGRMVNHRYEARHTLKQCMNDFDIYLTDMVYTDFCGKDEAMVRLSAWDDHITVPRTIIEHEDIFHKDYAWSYEKECRLIVKLSDEWWKKAQEEELTLLRINVPHASMRQMDEKRLIRSPVYDGETGNGTDSKLTGQVMW